MSRAAQNLLLILVAGAMLWITLGSGEYVNYVRPGFRFLLVPAALALLALGAAGLRREWRHTAPADDGHEHSRGPRAAWLLCLPILAVFLVAPPALGSFTVSRDTGRAAPPPVRPDEGFERLPSNGPPVPMTMQEFIGRAWEAQTRDPSKLEGVPVRLTGFVTPDRRGGWHVTRLKIACCAGDAVPFPVRVRGLPRPPEDTWVEVVGVWRPPKPGTKATVVQELSGRSLQRIRKPKNPYE
ncbi:putative repeat protein (TIGR03943 family) [Actinomadura pelletieri DSM 43383]|uniref:Putative repeat protein (TIGR03943 family) n=1 Tax=Actinomadura pelletieri DSM 43383 TaxID=1120940 RepID=A0A495QG03_9ACTN|nr:TIGR03943 family protein [Actinomadura pelletieri]RKS70794.1 putative repeat protein (TIGR03943 family) [Actinomadura pelletieri DSM 43383]